MTMASTTARRRGGWYYGWNIVAVCVLSQAAANGVPFNSMSLFLRPWSQELHAPISDILLAYLPMMIFMCLMSPLAGALADRRPARLLMGIGLAGVALTCLAMSAVTKVWQVQALYALALPIPISFSTAVVCNPVVSRWFVKRAGLALGICAFGIGIAEIVLPPVIAEMMPVIGWRNIWMFTGLTTGLVILPIVLLVMRDRPTEREGLHYVAGEGGAQLHHHGHGGGGQLRWIDIVKRKNFLLIAAAFLAIGFPFIGCIQNIAPIALSHGFAQKTAGMLLSVANISHVISTLLMGAMSDKIGNRVPLVILSLAAAGGALLMGFGSGLAAFAGGAALVGFCGGMFPVLAAAVGVEFGAAEMGRAFGVLMTLLIVPSVMPSLVAHVQEVTGSYSPVLLGMAILALMSVVLVLQLRERHHGHATPEEKEAALHAVDPIG